MKDKITISEQDKSLFRQSNKGVKKITADTVLFPARPKAFIRQRSDNITNKQARSFHFSDNYQPFLADDKPVCFTAPGQNKQLVKKLRKGLYYPELILDLHGLNQQQAKEELSALIDACEKQQVRCACVMTGFGKHILKNRVPAWLAQHPAVCAFHQATKNWGGKAALLILIRSDSEDENEI